MSDHQLLDERLNALPPKVAVPFRQLLASDLLPVKDAAIVLDAGALSGDTSRLLGFAVAYLHLRSTGVPVHDVIAMAKSQKRRVNLSWSAKRWKAEHERLSRAQALVKLADENVVYDLADFEAHLPKRFPGYLIRTSRRLGMEGLRQRHCVAAYHPRIVAGNCAIAAVFVDGTRWTVQLERSGHDETPLRITQIKTQLNGVSSHEINERIHDILGITPPQKVAAAMPVDQDGWLLTLRELLPVLRQHRVNAVSVTFEGYGDSGSIENIQYAAPDGFDAGAINLQYRTITSHFEDGRWVRQTEPTQGTIGQAVEELSYSYIQETGVDWYNNDGGFGELVIDVEQGTVSLEVNVRFTESACEFHAERDILTGEDLAA